MACVAERGFSATSTDHIAQRAGLSAGTLFRVFPTKAALLRATLGQAEAELCSPGDVNLAGVRTYEQFRDLWDRASRNALACPAAFEYWRLYRATPLDTDWGLPAEPRLGPFRSFGWLLAQAQVGHEHPRSELDAWLAAAQWAAAVHFLLAPEKTFRPHPAMPERALDRTAAPVLARAREACWAGLGIDRDYPWVQHAYM